MRSLCLLSRTNYFRLLVAYILSLRCFNTSPPMIIIENKFNNCFVIKCNFQLSVIKDTSGQRRRQDFGPE